MTVISDHMSLRLPIQRPASAPGQAPPRMQQNRTPVNLQQPIDLAGRSLPQARPQPAPLPALPFHLPMPFSSAYTNQSQPSSATAWILSSPTGPQAFLFSPNHGYFSSANSNAPPTHAASHSSPANPQVTVGDSNQVTNSAPAVARGTQGPAPGDANANRALVRQGPGARPALVQAQQNPQDNDMFGLIIQRGWLFLRMYLFMSIFSDQGSWKHWLMIVLAVFICLQPRDGPLTRALTAARQYFDNLIGPAAPRPRQRLHKGAKEESKSTRPLKDPPTFVAGFR